MKVQLSVLLCHGWAAVFFLAWAVGCGQTGPTRYDMSGTVTYDGQPVPTGTISFDPVGRDIGGGFAQIVDGNYDTSQDGRGHIGGEHVVHITGDAGEPPAPDSPEADSYVAKELFPPYETSVELPEEITTMDFEVPAK